jgi:two-component system, cell cycle response regulator DivK
MDPANFISHDFLGCPGRIGAGVFREFGENVWKSTGRTSKAMARILLVEDNEMNRDMLSRRLERKGFSVLIAVDGQEGICMAGLERPDLILMDLSLPLVDGWEATRRLKADPQTSGIPVIALTAHAMAADEQKAREAGCDDFDTKPIEFARLLGKIEAQLGGGGGVQAE